MKLKCRLGFHNQSRWRDAGEGKISAFGFLSINNSTSEPVLFQERICGDCHIKQRQYVRYREGK